MNLSEAIRALRRQRQWTQRRLAAELNVAPGAIANWEQGTRKPEAKLATKMAGFCDMEASDVLARHAGIEHLAPYYSRSAMKGLKPFAVAESTAKENEIAIAESEALRGIRVLAEAASIGNEAAKELLRDLSYQIIRRAEAAGLWAKGPSPPALLENINSKSFSKGKR